MNFNIGYAILFALCGYVAGGYQLKKGDSAKSIPIIGLVACVGVVLSRYDDWIYGFLTAIEYGVGFGLAHMQNSNNKD